MYKVEDVKNCPFCDGHIYNWNKDYFACCHFNGCFMVTGVNQDWRTEVNVTLILKRKDYVDAWNKRPENYEKEWEDISPVATSKFMKTRPCKIKVISRKNFKSATIPGEFSDEDY